MTPLSLLFLAIRISGLVAIAAILNAARPRAAAAEKHWVWMTALVAALVLPLAQGLVPEWRVGPRIAAFETQPHTVTSHPVVADNVSLTTIRPATPSNVAARDTVTLSRRHYPSAIAIVLAAWTLGTLLCLVRLARAHAHARRIVWSAQRADVLDASLPILLSEAIEGPFTYGIIRPSIVLPIAAVSWSSNRRAAVVTHEMSHALRRDGLSLLVTEVACAAYWWHPAVLFAARRAAVACERACDDAVVRGGMRASEYGAQLLAQAQSSCAWGIRPLATTLFGPSQGIASRIAALLDPRIDRRPLLRRRALAVSFLGLGTSGFVAAASPQRAEIRSTLEAVSAPAITAASESAATEPVATPKPKPTGANASKRPTRLAFAPACMQAADTRKARTLKVDSSLSFQGAGSTRYGDGTMLLVWTGVDCAAWVKARGPISVDATWSAVSAGPSAEFTAHDEGPAGRRDYVVKSDGSTLTVDGAAISIAAEHRAWIAMMVLEYVRRTGYDITTRARAILAKGGVPALLDETRRISGKEVRKRYLEVAFSEVDPSSRVAFVHDAASLLDSAFVRGEFLLAIPREWRDSLPVLAAMYEEAGAIEPDEYIEQVLRTAPPPRPTPAQFKPLLEKLIASLQSVDRRRALSAYYLDVRP